MKILHIYICLVMVFYRDSFLKYLALLVQNLKKKDPLFQLSDL